MITNLQGTSLPWIMKSAPHHWFKVGGGAGEGIINLGGGGFITLPEKEEEEEEEEKKEVKEEEQQEHEERKRAGVGPTSHNWGGGGCSGPDPGGTHQICDFSRESAYSDESSKGVRNTDPLLWLV